MQSDGESEEEELEGLERLGVDLEEREARVISIPRYGIYVRGIRKTDKSTNKSTKSAIKSGTGTNFTTTNGSCRAPGQNRRVTRVFSECEGNELKQRDSSPIC